MPAVQPRDLKRTSRRFGIKRDILPKQIAYALEARSNRLSLPSAHIAIPIAVAAAIAKFPPQP